MSGKQRSGEEEEKAVVGERSEPYSGPDVQEAAVGPTGAFLPSVFCTDCCGWFAMTATWGQNNRETGDEAFAAAQEKEGAGLVWGGSDGPF